MKAYTPYNPVKLKIFCRDVGCWGVIHGGQRSVVVDWFASFEAALLYVKDWLR